MASEGAPSCVMMQAQDHQVLANLASALCHVRTCLASAVVDTLLLGCMPQTFRSGLMEELDFRFEAHNAKLAAHMLKTQESVKVCSKTKRKQRYNCFTLLSSHHEASVRTHNV
jgi:hypothetical protein